MKTFFATLFALLLGAASLTAQPFGPPTDDPLVGQIKLVTPLATYVGGEQVDVALRVNTSQPLFAVAGVLRYENNELEYVQNSLVAGDHLGTDILTDFDPSGEDISFAITRQQVGGTRTGVTGLGTILQLSFTVRSTVGIRLSSLYILSGSIEAIDENGDPLPLNDVDIQLSISETVVWPGDLNNNGTVEITDPLEIGVYFDERVEVRPNASYEWIPQPARFDNVPGATYADGDGNGRVRRSDLFPVGYNFGNTVPVTTANLNKTGHSLSGEYLTLSSTLAGSSLPGEELRIIIDASGEDILGVALGLEQSPYPLIGFERIEYGDFLGDSVYTFEHVDSNNIQVALTKKASDGAVSGSGKLLTLVMRISPQARIGDVINFSFTTAEATNQTGERHTVSARNFSVQVDSTLYQPETLPLAFQLYQNYPNPFNPATTISYDIVAPDDVRLSIYNILGQEVTTLVDRFQEAGDYRVRWDGTDSYGNLVANGVYLYRLQVGNFVDTKKMIFLQ